MAFKELTGMWRSPKGSLSFKMSQEFKDRVVSVPNGTYINVFEVREKANPKAPDAKLTYRVDDGPHMVSHPGEPDNAWPALDLLTEDDIPF